MSTQQKDKRTKEQLLQILSNALTQEEQLGEKIKMLESQLAACQKQNEEAQAEGSPYGLSASKESFRIDYYKASENGRLKGIIEHLPSQQKKSLQGLGIKHIALFMERFLPEEIKQQKTVDAPLVPAIAKAPFLPATSVETDQPATWPQETPVAGLDRRREEVAVGKTAAAPLAADQPEANLDTGILHSQLAQRLRARRQSDPLKTSGQLVGTIQPRMVAAPLPRSPHADRILTKITAWPVENKMPIAQPQPTVALPVGSKSRLSERLRVEFQAGMPKR